MDEEQAADQQQQDDHDTNKPACSPLRCRIIRPAVKPIVMFDQGTLAVKGVGAITGVDATKAVGW